MDRKIDELWKSRTTVLEMFEDRKYKVLPKYLELTIEDIIDITDTSELEEALTIYATNKENLVGVFWYIENFNAPEVQLLVDTLKEKKCYHAIIVTNKEITANTKKIVQDFRHYSYDGKNLRFEFFLQKNLIINVTKHVLVPRHKICSLKRKNEIMQKYNATATQLPSISIHDPIIRYLGAKKGNLIEIYRDNGEGGFYLTYRIVTNPK